MARQPVGFERDLDRSSVEPAFVALRRGSLSLALHSNRRLADGGIRTPRYHLAHTLSRRAQSTTLSPILKERHCNRKAAGGEAGRFPFRWDATSVPYRF